MASPRRTGPKGFKRQPGRWSAIDKISQDKVRLLLLEGWTDKKIANFFGITPVAWCLWKKRHPKFLLLHKEWRKEAARRVEKSMFKVAEGFEYKEKSSEQEVMRLPNGRTARSPRKIKVVFKKVLPNVDAGKFILTNHMPETYKNRQDSRNVNLNGQADDKEFRDKFFGIAAEEEEKVK